MKNMEDEIKTCPTCGCPCKIEGEVTLYYSPIYNEIVNTILESVGNIIATDQELLKDIQKLKEIIKEYSK